MKKKRNFSGVILVIIAFIILFRSNVFSNLGNNRDHIKSGSGNYTLDSEYVTLDNIESKNAIVIDRDSKEIIMGKNTEERIHPASMTKVMTAIVGLENTKNLKKRIEITNDIIDYCNRNGLSVSGFEVGDKPKVIDLLYGILLESGGESSITLAREVAGSKEGFVNLMNKKARELGMVNTHFSNPTGITDSENYSTPKDIALLFDYALNNSEFKNIVDSKEYTAKGVKGLFSKHSIYNSLFQKRNMLDINKNYIKCGKTGYTEAAGLCLVSLGEVNGKEYIVVTAKANGNSTTPQYNLLDTSKIYNRLENIK